MHGGVPAAASSAAGETGGAPRAAYGPASGLSPVRAGPLLPAPVLVSFTGPAPQSRLTVLVRIVLATPQLIVVTLLSIAAWAVMVAGWSAALFTGRLPG